MPVEAPAFVAQAQAHLSLSSASLCRHQLPSSSRHLKRSRPPLYLHRSRLGRLGGLPSLPDTLLIHQQETSLPKLWKGLRPAVLEPHDAASSLRDHGGSQGLRLVLGQEQSGWSGQAVSLVGQGRRSERVSKLTSVSSSVLSLSTEPPSSTTPLVPPVQLRPSLASP